MSVSDQFDTHHVRDLVELLRDVILVHPGLDVSDPQRASLLLLLIWLGRRRLSDVDRRICIWHATTRRIVRTGSSTLAHHVHTVILHGRLLHLVMLLLHIVVRLLRMTTLLSRCLRELHHVVIIHKINKV